MAEKRTIGQILLNLGRIDENDVQRALAYQEKHGGFFGEALVGLEILSQEELDWGLASQFDLPYVMPDAESIDPDAVAYVSPEWALANLTLPIMKVGGLLTVLVDSPIKTEALDILAARSEMEVQPALASASKIRELIRQVFAREAQGGDAAASPGSLAEAMEKVMEAGAVRYGISARGPRAWVWYTDEGTVRRRPLVGPWREQLSEIVSPPPDEVLQPGQSRASWDAGVAHGGFMLPVEITYLASAQGEEFLFSAVEQRARAADRFEAPPKSLVTEVGLLTRSGSARFAVVLDPPDLGEDLIPHLPTLLLERSWRTALLTDRETEASEEVFSAWVPPDPDDRSRELRALRAFQFDAVSVDLQGPLDTWVPEVLDVAPVAFLRWPAGAGRSEAKALEVRWELRVSRGPEGGLSWALDPIH